MFTASDATALADGPAELDRVIEQIKRAARAGDRSITCVPELADDTIKELEFRGFWTMRVTAGNFREGGPATKVSWK